MLKNLKKYRIFLIIIVSGFALSFYSGKYKVDKPERPSALVVPYYNMLTIAAGDEEPENMKGITARHNYWRAKLGITPLEWSDELAKVAQDWAEQLKKKGCKMQHRPDNDYGENIYWAMGMEVKPNAPVDAWAAEQKDFNFETLECNKEWYYCGHFTQLVWENTKKVGCGMARCSDGAEIWVCNYDPPGNYTGQKPYKKKK